MARKVHLTGSRPDLRVPMRLPWLLGRGDVGIARANVEIPTPTRRGRGARGREVRECAPAAKSQAGLVRHPDEVSATGGDHARDGVRGSARGRVCQRQVGPIAGARASVASRRRGPPPPKPRASGTARSGAATAPGRPAAREPGRGLRVSATDPSALEGRLRRVSSA